MKSDVNDETVMSQCQLMFDFDEDGSVRILVGNRPKAETCGCSGQRDGECATRTAPDVGESCPGCGAPLHSERSCLVCKKCGYRSCGD